jgi:hypothetical protein
MIQKALITAGLNKAAKKANTPKDNKLRNNIIFGVVVVAGVIITTKFFKKQIANFIQKRKEENELNKEIKTKGTLPPSQYRDLADGIQKAFMPYESLGIGTDEAAIYNIFRMLKNNDDFLLLKNQYGIREYVDYTVNPFGTKYNFNMSQAINFEDEGSEMKNRINNILKVKGITYRI